jgi:hypothetical protein
VQNVVQLNSHIFRLLRLTATVTRMAGDVPLGTGLVSRSGSTLRTVICCAHPA